MMKPLFPFTDSVDSKRSALLVALLFVIFFVIGVTSPPSPSKADLVITDFSTLPTSPEFAKNVWATVIIQNKGEASAEGFPVRRQAHEAYVGFFPEVLGLSLGQSRLLAFDFVYPNSSAFDTEVMADHLNAVNENNWDNNSRTLDDAVSPTPGVFWVIPDPARLPTESGGSEYNLKVECADNHVFIGRYHSGDEKGTTLYKSTSLIVCGNPTLSVTTAEHKWEDGIKESAGIWFQTTEGRVITGREHRGDENGKTYYRTSAVFVSGVRVFIQNRTFSSRIKESSGIWFDCPNGYVMTGRYHRGDENGYTTYEYAKLAYFF